ncbi:MAG: amidohydrolase family protein [Pseudomonadota bacterium]
MRIDAHHHLWDLNAVSYPWIMDKAPRFFGDHTPIRRDYLIDEFRADATAHDITGSVHIQVGAADPVAEARWIQSVAEANPDWPLVQVAFCDLTADDFAENLEQLRTLSTLRGVRQIVGRSPEEDAATGTNDLLDNPRFLDGLKRLGDLGLSFDLQLIPELMPRMAEVIAQAPNTSVGLCHAGSPYDRSETGLEKWSANLKSLSALETVSCKLSGFGMFDHNWTQDDLKPVLETCLQQFGSKRVMFGSNFPVDSLSGNYMKLITAYAALLETDLHPDIFGNTAVQFYGFENPNG